MSSKKRFSNTGGAKQKRRKTNDESDRFPDIFKGKSLFIKMVKEAGLLLMDGSTPNAIKCDQSVFLKDFAKIIKRHDDYPEVVEDIMEGFEKYVDDNDRFVRSMLTTDLKNDDSEVDGRSAQDSMIRLMLKTRPLQSRIVHSVIKKLEIYKDDSNIQLAGGSQQGAIDVPQLIMNQLRWLDTLDDARSAAEKLLATAAMMNYQSACGIITSLPEIISDDIHDIVAIKLKELLSSNVELALSILDALCSLSCSDKTMEDVKQAVFACLHTVKIEELPIVVKYLLQTMTPGNAESSINCLRQYLTFSPSGLSQSSQSSGGNQKGNEETSLRLTAEAIISAIQYQPSVAESWIKLLKSLPEEEFTSTDFVTLVLLCSNCNSAQKKLAFALAKSKLQSHKISEPLLCSTFEDCSHVLIPYFATLSDIAGTCVSSKLPALQHMGVVLYTCMFSNLDGFCRQEVIGCLVQHVGSSCASEVDNALKVMRLLSVDHLELLLPFTLFIKDILDHVDCLSCHQVRLVYEVLSRLAFSRRDGKSHAVQNELHMLIRKQLSHTSPKYCYIGIIGATNILSVLGAQGNCDNAGYKHAVSVLKLLEETTQTNSKLRAYYLDEISELFHEDFDSKLRKRLYKTFCKELEDKILSLEEAGTSTQSATNVPKFPISENLQMKIPIFPAVRMSDSRHEILCPLFRAILQSDETKSSRLRDIALSPILLRNVFSLPSFKVLGSTEQRMVLDSLFVALNWFREHVCALAREEADLHHALNRVDHVLKLEKLIEALMPAVQRYSAPLAIPDFNTSANQVFTKDCTNSGTTQEGKDATATENNETACDGETLGDKTVGKAVKTNKKKTETVFTVKEMKPQFFRELDVVVFNLLKLPMGENLFEKDINTETDSEPSAQLMPDHLLFLLHDLRNKIQKKLSPDGEKKASPFGNAPSHVGYENLEKMSEAGFGREICNLLVHLCDHLEAVCAPFQGDGDADIDDLEVEKRHILVNCYEHLTEVLHSIISWKGVQDDGKLQQTMLLALGRRISADIGTDSSMREILKSAFSYMKNFESTVTKVSLGSSASLAKLLSTLSALRPDCEACFTQEMQDFTMAMLKVDWPMSGGQSAVSGMRRNEMLGTLLRLHLRYTGDILKTLSHFVDEGLCKLDQHDDDRAYPCFKRANVHVLFGCLIEALAEESHKIPGIKAKDDESTGIDLLLKWNDCMKIVGVLIRLLRDFHQKTNVVSALKYGRMIIESFIKTGMPLCEKMFHLYQDDVIGLLKHLQISTRQLQHFTCHTKVTKDVSMAKHVPPLKKCLETLLFRVKGMLALHNCQAAFWLGNLKNRDLQGDEILSQAIQHGDEPEEESENITGDVDMSYSESY